MTMTNGYPAEADIDTYLNDLGIEIVTENNPNFFGEYKQELWGQLNALRFAMSLSVYPASSTTFNVRGGDYLFEGEVKTYTPGSAVDPTDNDTTYVWMKPDNTIGSDIDGNGWPSTEHIKLAEIDVDSSGIITDIRDLRGQHFLNYLTTYHTFILKATISAGSTVQIHNTNAPFKYRILDAWSIAKSADGGSWKLTDGSNDITDTVTVTGTDKTINRVGTIDDTYWEIAKDGSLSVVGDGSLADAEVYILCIRVA